MGEREWKIVGRGGREALARVVQACRRKLDTLSTPEIPAVVATCERLEAQAQDVAWADEGVAFEEPTRTRDLVREAVRAGASGAVGGASPLYPPITMIRFPSNSASRSQSRSSQLRSGRTSNTTNQP